MEFLNKIGNIVYAYCTDFIINLANLLGLSYYEINALVFCFIYPVSIVCLIVIYSIQNKRLKNLKNNIL